MTISVPDRVTVPIEETDVDGKHCKREFRSSSTFYAPGRRWFAGAVQGKFEGVLQRADDLNHVSNLPGVRFITELGIGGGRANSHLLVVEAVRGSIWRWSQAVTDAYEKNVAPLSVVACYRERMGTNSPFPTNLVVPCLEATGLYRSQADTAQTRRTGDRRSDAARAGPSRQGPQSLNP